MVLMFRMNLTFVHERSLYLSVAVFIRGYQNVQFNGKDFNKRRFWIYIYIYVEGVPQKL